MKLTKKIEDKIQEFGEQLGRAAQSWVEAGKILVEILDDDPQSMDRILEAYPTITHSALVQLEAVGRGVLDERLLTTSTPGGRALRRMPISVQRRFLNECVDLVVETQEGTDVLLVATDNLTPKQTRQVFSSQHCRTPAEQKAWLVENRPKRARNIGEATPAWTVKGSRVVFLEGASLSAGELATIITQITR